MRQRVNQFDRKKKIMKTNLETAELFRDLCLETLIN